MESTSTTFTIHYFIFLPFGQLELKKQQVSLVLHNRPQGL